MVSKMKLLVVTDHRYYGTADGVFDTYGFDRGFFQDYRSVFEEVKVLARLRKDAPPATAARSDGDGVTFLALPDVSGPRLDLALYGSHASLVRDAVQRADAVCLRVPSVSGAHAFRAARKLGRPIMFEAIGDPGAAITVAEHGRIATLYGKWHARRLRSITQAATVGSYVSRKHLQRTYPPGPRTTHDSISSIRLPSDTLRPAKQFSTPPVPLKVVLVASLVPIKRHDVLIKGLHVAASRGTPVRLRLVGDGPLRQQMEQLCASLGMQDRVDFLGHVAARADVNRILDESDIFVMTSASEGMPRAMIEGMARGLPAIGSDVGGIAEILPLGQLFPAGDHDRLGDLLADLQRDPARLSSYAEHSEKTAREFTIEQLSARRRRLLMLLRNKARGGRHQ